jgi:hypothetical protein
VCVRARACVRVWCVFVVKVFQNYAHVRIRRLEVMYADEC